MRLFYSYFFFPLLLVGGVSCQENSTEEQNTAANTPLFGTKTGKKNSNHKLKDLTIFAQDIQLMKNGYVDSHLFKEERIDAMFMGIVNTLETDIDEVRLVRKDNQLYVTVGTHTQEFSVPKFSSLDSLYNAVYPIAGYLEDNLSAEVDRAEVEYSIINGAFTALDPHTVLLPPVQAAEMDVDNSGEFGGLGIEIYVEEGELTVRRPIEGTPASRAGIQEDDKIVQIEEFSTINMDVMEAVSILRGPIGEPVTIYVARKGWKSPQAFTIVRGRIKIDPVTVELLSNNIAYIRIQSFNANVSNDMNSFLDDLQKKTSLRGIILDLRHNPGGYLKQAQLVADKFIDKGVLVSTVEGSERTKDYLRATKKGSITDVPMTVLINGNSASASEIVAGAVRNLNRGVIIGERSFGKGSVQQLHRNIDGSKLKLTIAQYLTPGDRSIQSVGIPPDIALHRSIVEKEEEEEIISLYWEDWAEKEVDLQHHLDNAVTIQDKETYNLRYLQPKDYSPNRIDPKTDWEVQFAKRVLKRAPVANRTSALKALGGLVEEQQKAEDLRLREAFQKLERDWRSGDNPAVEDLSIDVKLEGMEQFVAGKEHEVKLSITNTSAAPLHQISIWTESKSPVMDKREFYIGYLDVNQTSEQTKKIRFPYGYSEQKDDFSIVVRDQDNKELKRIPAQFFVKQHKRPIFSYAVKFIDDGSGDSKGNGDGIPQDGESIELDISLTNIGDGAAVRPFVSLKNKARKYLNLKKGNLELGTWKTLDQKDCKKEERDCFNLIKPGETFSGRLRFEVREGFDATTDKPYMNIQIGDNYAYDYNTIRAGFGSYFRMEHRVDIIPKTSLKVVSQQQPQIQISKKTEEVSGTHLIFISGTVNDERAVKQLMVFHNDQKIFYRGEDSPIQKLPFSVEAILEEGNNRFSFLAKDDEGLTTTETIYFYRQ